MKVPFFDYSRQYKISIPRLLNGISKIIEDGHFINGPSVNEFEQKFSSFVNASHCIGVSSGTDALTVAIMAAKKDKHKNVALCPSFTFTASAMSALREGYQIRFLDVKENSFKPSIEEVISKICNQTSLIIWPYLFGEPTDLRLLKSVCDQKNITLIEDCAQSLGTYSNGEHVGKQGHVACYSFFPAKNLGAFGDGGAITTNNEESYREMLKIKNHGYEKNKKYFSERIGGNFRLDTIQAEILLNLIPSLNSWLESRKQNALFYDANIINNLITKPEILDGHSWNQYTLIVDDNEKFSNYMQNFGISTMIYYPHPLHQNPVFGCDVILRNTETLCKKVISLPVYPGLSKEELLYTVEKINEYK